MMVQDLGPPAPRSHVLRTAQRLLRVDPDVPGALSTPPGRSSPIVVLAVGTDRRARLSWRYRRIVQGTVAGARADAILVVVVLPARSAIEVIVVPRGIATRLDGIGVQRVGWALEYGGPTLLTSAVRSMLRLPIHHYVELDFQGFAAIIDAVGGAAMATDRRLRDSRSGLDLAAGQHHLDGVGALAFARSRHQEEGGLVKRLGERDRQERLALVIRSIAATSVLANVGLRNAWSVARAARRIVVDPGLQTVDLEALLTTALGGTVGFHYLPSKASMSPNALTSPFPPHLRTGSAYLELEPNGAEEVIEPLRRLIRGGDAET